MMIRRRMYTEVAAQQQWRSATPERANSPTLMRVCTPCWDTAIRRWWWCCGDGDDGGWNDGNGWLRRVYARVSGFCVRSGMSLDVTRCSNAACIIFVCLVFAAGWLNEWGICLCAHGDSNGAVDHSQGGHSGILNWYALFYKRATKTVVSFNGHICHPVPNGWHVPYTHSEHKFILIVWCAAMEFWARLLAVIFVVWGNEVRSSNHVVE